MRIRDPGWRQFGSGMEKVGSGINIPDPQHWFRNKFLGLNTLFFDAYPGWKRFGSGIRDGKNSDPGYLSWILIFIYPGFRVLGLAITKEGTKSLLLTQQVLRNFFSNFGLNFQHVSPLDPWI
jgi:hypothetical protein